jgi:hypothetical protein
VNFVGGYADAWWKLQKGMDAQLSDASRDLDPDGRYRLRLGSPVLIGRVDRDVMRAPVILAGGPREQPVAYLVFESVNFNKGRARQIAAECQRLARAQMTGNSATPGKDLELTYS